ncbi:MAG: SDR family oxidoreductase [Actinomycetota bacterium]
MTGPAIVTGASSGIGAATARALAAAGHPIALGARRVERCEAIAGEITAAGGQAVGLSLDLADAGSVKDFAAAAESALGPIDVLVSNAGETRLGTGVDVEPDVFARLLEVNLLGAQRLVSLIAPSMIERARGDIVFVSSDAVEQPRPRMASYVSAKAGLEGLARTMQLELEGSGVRVSIVRPGHTLTEMGSGWDPAVVKDFIGELKRWGLMRHRGLLRPDDVARVIVHVVSMPRGAHITAVDVQPEAPVKKPEESS